MTFSHPSAYFANRLKSKRRAGNSASMNNRMTILTKSNSVRNVISKFWKILLATVLVIGACIMAGCK